VTLAGLIDKLSKAGGPLEGRHLAVGYQRFVNKNFGDLPREVLMWNLRTLHDGGDVLDVIYKDIDEVNWAAFPKNGWASLRVTDSNDHQNHSPTFNAVAYHMSEKYGANSKTYKEFLNKCTPHYVGELYSSILGFMCPLEGWLVYDRPGEGIKVASGPRGEVPLIVDLPAILPYIYTTASAGMAGVPLQPERVSFLGDLSKRPTLVTPVAALAHMMRGLSGKPLAGSVGLVAHTVARPHRLADWELYLFGAPNGDVRVLCTGSSDVPRGKLRKVNPGTARWGYLTQAVTAAFNGSFNFYDKAALLPPFPDDPRTGEIREASMKRYNKVLEAWKLKALVDGLTDAV